ncbi:MAG: hypothetical protein PHX63_08120 [Eubacteriales bacterium]|nr:hypothetical protein [Eubacteriales bacterium]
MKKRNFSLREKILFTILAVLLIAVMYYQFVLGNVDKASQKYDLDALNEELQTEQIKAASITSMQKEIEAGKAGAVTYIASYDNLRNEMKALNDILAASSSYSLNFSNPVKEDNIVRRDIKIDFTARNYAGAKNILKALYDCEYRCLIRDINMSNGPGNTGGISSGVVDVNLTVTFFETMHNADSYEGLEEAQND